MAINYQQLHDWITGNQDCTDYIVINSDQKQNAAGKDANIADICNAQIWAKEVKDTYISIPSLMAGVGPVLGAGILDKIEEASITNSILKWTLYPIKTEQGINIGDPITRSALLNLSGNVLTSEEVQAILNLAIKPIIVTGRDVSIALRGDAAFTPGI